MRSGAVLAAAVLSLAVAGCGVGTATGAPATSGPAGSSGTAASGAAPRTTGPGSPSAPAPGGGATPIPAAGSGVAGSTVVDGGCPVIRTDSPCPDRPFRAHLTVADADSGTVAATADSDSGGQFRIPLPPGRYVVRAANPNGAPLPRAVPVTTTVVSGRYTTLSIRFDSGIR